MIRNELFMQVLAYPIHPLDALKTGGWTVSVCAKLQRYPWLAQTTFPSSGSKFHSFNVGSTHRDKCRYMQFFVVVDDGLCIGSVCT